MAYSAIVRFSSVISVVTLAVMSACSDDDDSSVGGTGGTGGDDAGAGSGGEDGSTAGSGGSTGGSGGSGGAMPEAAVGPEVFTCSMDADGGPGMCNYMCEGACTVECLGGRCTADCPAGGCTHDADFEAVAAYTCEGGGCMTDCDNASDCTVNCTGGGCDVTCDVASKCNVDCPESAGAACNVTCVEGGTATCTPGSNCTFNNCMPCDPTPDPSYMPTIDPADFSTTIDNPLFPLTVGATWVYNAPDEVITVTVTDMTYTVAMGVECVVVHDQVCSTNSDLLPDGCDGVGGDLIEDTLDWYAQDSAGNVWYFGEETTEYVNGVPANTRGAWEAGVDGALPGIIMNATVMMQDVGNTYRQEYLVCQAEDEGEIMAVDESVTVPTGTYTGCVRIRDFSRLDPTSNEYKTYCPDIGVVLVTDVATGERLEELNMVSGL